LWIKGVKGEGQAHNFLKAQIIPGLFAALFHQHVQ